MIEQLSFYIRHSFNDLRVNGQRTIFALLAIAAGVAAIVSLQTLAVMIGDTLVGNLQANNRGDIQLQVDVLDEDNLMPGIDQGYLDEVTFSFFGQTSTEYRLNTAGYAALQGWVDERYAGQVEITTRQALTSFLDLMLGTGTGTNIVRPDSGDQVSQASGALVDASVYPYYGDFTMQDGTTLADALNEPTDVAVNDKIAETLGLQVGDVIHLNGSEADFTVRGIFDTGQDLNDPASPDLMGALFGGLYLLDNSAAALFDLPMQPFYVYFQVGDPALVAEINDALLADFPFFSSRTTEDLRTTYQQLSDSVGQLMTVMGLLSLLIGSIGIINTMQVIVRRRTVEVAVLKTLGLQANQVTVLFLVEAFIMGLLGSLAGIVLGWLGVFVLKGAAETWLVTELPFRIVPGPALSGLVVGTVVTTVFGFLPTLTAGQVRPGVVLRPNDNIVPRAGLGRALLALAVTILVLTLIAQTILGSFQTALQVIIIAFIAAGILYLLLGLMVWLVGRFLPSFGVVDLRISLRQMLAGRQRAATTLLALVIGVFSLSLITLFADSINNLLSFALEEGSGGNISIQTASAVQAASVEDALNASAGVNSYQVITSYSAIFSSLEDNGTVVTPEELADRLSTFEIGGGIGPGGGAVEEGSISGLEIFEASFGAIDARRLDQLPGWKISEGRDLTPEDAGQPVAVLQTNNFTRAAGVSVGDRITLEVGGSGGGFGAVGGSDGTGVPFTVEIVGISDPGMFGASGMSSALYVPADALPEGVPASSTNVVADVDDDAVPALRRELSAIPGTFVLETAIFTQLIRGILGTFTAFPTLVAALGLIVGGVVIANSVALTTMERRKEIAVMKAVGLQRERVLGMLLLENGVMGLIGGLVGVGIGLVGLVIMVGAAGLPSSTLPLGTALLLMSLCILVALIAAITTAWGASGEKPLNVLRYD